ncbi:hypothetical protein PHLH8_25400 [Pseudomonas sp. Pc102]|nr:hypothetical protein PHLH8_25400 [Pseudomonas sp. Pc102]
MPSKKLLACVTALLLLTCGCQSYSTQALPAATVECLPPPPPAAWFMQPREPNLTQRMLNEFSPSSVTATKD